MIIIKRYRKFSIFWFVNAVLLFLAVTFMPMNYTLGNNLFTPLQALVFNAFVWNFVVWNTDKFMDDMEIKLKNPAPMMLAYLASNFFTLWLLARFAVITGFGVSSAGYVLILAFVANIIQFLIWKGMDKK